MESEPQFIEEYKKYIANAIDVGSKIFHSDGITRVIKHLKRNLDYDDSDYLLVAMEGTLNGAIIGVQEELQKARQPPLKQRIKSTFNKSKNLDGLKEQAVDLTKLAYLSSLMLETIVASQKYSDDNETVTAREKEFFQTTYNSVFSDIGKLTQKGINFDSINEIRQMNKEGAYCWLKDRM